MMNLLKTISRNIPQLNWMRIGLLLVLLASWTVFVDQRARHKCELKQEQQRTEAAEKKTEEIVEHVEKRIPVINKKQADTAALHAEINRLRYNLREAINANQHRPTSPSCDLTQREFDSVRELIEQSKASAR